ncbi:DUF4386 domain-containing protein [Paenibacillus sp. GCM10027626]|uniref:DUF4386 domain-containing protein n=1 Tax=Paenibacillus sp. GCM10027626 TaxID=3273411 RepID=UPI00362B299E
MTVSTHGRMLQQRTSALIAGISLIVMAIAAFFSYGFIHESLVVQGDAAATFHNISSSSHLFTAEIFSWLIIVIADILVSWALYLFLQPIHKSLSLLGAWLRLVYTAILAIAILNLLFVLLLVKPSFDLSSFTIEQIQALMMLFLRAFESIWSIGLVIFGGHLMASPGLFRRSV